MKWILYTDEIEISELCEWVKEGGGVPMLYMNLGDLESDKDYVRFVDVADDTKCRVLSDNLRPLPDDEWIPFENLSYDKNAGLRWSK